MFRVSLIFSRAFSPLSVRLAALAAAALPVFAGCVTSRNAPGQDGGVVESDMIALPQQDELPSVHDAAVAARAAAAAAAADVAPAAAAPTAAPAPAPSAPTAAPAPAPSAPTAAPAPSVSNEIAPAPVALSHAAPATAEATPAQVFQPGVSAAATHPSHEALAALAAAGSSSNDHEVFTDDETKSQGNKFEPIIGQGYRLKLLVRVGDRDEVGPLEVMVSGKGDISLPIVGRVQCEGLTIPALHSRLAGIYSEYFTDPDVDVMFAYSDDGISPYGQVLVQGRVRQEGWVNIPPTRNLRLSHAIQRSGGFASSALRRKVLVLRRGENGELDRHVIDFKAIGKNGELDNDILLEPYDVIFVDESNF